MRKLCKRSKEKDVGSIGIGAMIVFIAMVLVAGIAASVLISTSTSLEMQALKTGQESIAEVASGIKIEGVEGYQASQLITKMAIEITSRAGSPDVDLSQAIVEISDSSNKYVLRVGADCALATAVNGDLFGVTHFGDADDFDLIVLQDADSSCASATTPIINFGDHVVLALDIDGVFTSNSGIGPRTDVAGMVIVEEGAPGILGFTTPSSYTDTTMELQ